MPEITAHEYHADVRSMAEEIGLSIRAGDVDEDEASDRVHMDVDGSCWVIYTFRATKVCEYSDNDAAYFEDFGALENVTCWSDVVTPLAYAAMRRDVEEALSTWLEENPASDDDA